MDCISSKQGDEGDGEEAVPRGPGAEEIRPRVPHVFSDLDVTIHSRPGDLEFNKSHSLSPKGMQQAHDIRVRARFGLVLQSFCNVPDFTSGDMGMVRVL